MTRPTRPGAAEAPPFRTVLVANRGEIAVRIIRTLRDLGIRSVAVYSDADADAPHVRAADEAVRLGPAPAAQSYLDLDAVIAAARATEAEAIHPGYGFLSERAAFARACADAGIVFIGPGERALEVMGDKIAAKTHVAASGVPVVPGVGEPGMSDDELAAAADGVGYPLLVKPSAGGGGKGMQVVRDRAALPAAIASARRVAAASFGDDALLVERFIEEPRHIEVQVLADEHGHVVHLAERECSLQRRHQKVIEEAPSPLLDPETRERIGRAACEAARSVDYRGAGTVEFLVSAREPGTFFFIEMNTRLQVEHPVTELVTGVDLVAEQLRIAAGRPLPFTQDEIVLTGHAIEARVYAESPSRGFLPSTGTVLEYDEPTGPGVRVDSGITTGSGVTADYDPMLAKVIASGADRDEAIGRLDRALAETVILGVDTGIPFLRLLLADPAVRAGTADTGLIDRLGDLAPVVPDDAVLAELARGLGAVDAVEPGPAGENWRTRSGFRLGGAVPRRFDLLTEDGEVHEMDASAPPSASRLRWVTMPRDPEASGPTDRIVLGHANGLPFEVRVLDRRTRIGRELARRKAPAGAMRIDPELRSPMPGTVTVLFVADGDRVAAGDPVLAIEAMKMEHRVTAPVTGTVRLAVTSGEQVARDRPVARIEPDPAADPAAGDVPDEQRSPQWTTT